MAEKCASVNNEDCPPTKKIKVDDGNTAVVEKKLDENNTNETELDLSGFKVTRVLQNNCARKLICMEGTFKDREGPAVVLLEQRSFPYDKVVLEKDFFDRKTTFRKVFTNDVYRNYNCFPTEEHNSILICLCRFPCILMYSLLFHEQICFYSSRPARDCDISRHADTYRQIQEAGIIYDR